AFILSITSIRGTGLRRVSGEQIWLSGEREAVRQELIVKIRNKREEEEEEEEEEEKKNLLEEKLGLQA
ncbi:MAG: hypothetical protein Q9157_008725, partial [Trypethelium eluteriae]